ncbi:CopD family protein, partial [Vibrio parahaemolyticus]
MIKRLLYGITLPSAILTLVFGIWILILYPSIPLWLYIKMGLVLLLFVYHFSLHVISNQQFRKNFRYSSNQ